jgi:hypothetical protein
MTHSRAQLIDALMSEYHTLSHDDFNDNVMNDVQYHSFLQSLTLEQLIAETDTDDEFTLDDFMYAYS